MPPREQKMQPFTETISPISFGIVGAGLVLVVIAVVGITIG